jgi:hypothetical protein
MYGQMMMPYMSLPAIYSRMPLPSDMVEEQPTYVNAKQYRRIIKRRQARALLEKRRGGQLTPAGRKNYLHESRHKHACRRPRGPGGRFLTKDELDSLRRFVSEGLDEKEAMLAAVAEIAAAKAGDTGSAPGMQPSTAQQTSVGVDGPSQSHSNGQVPPPLPEASSAASVSTPDDQQNESSRKKPQRVAV